MLLQMLYHPVMVLNPESLDT